jgi:hypothetical protein
MKTNELTGKALNWAVGKAEGLDDWLAPVNYCGQWEHGGPIIEREGISVAYDVELSQAEGSEYWATIYAVDSGDGRIYGPTPLIAAMRCYVASKLGDEVEIPEELL